MFKKSFSRTYRDLIASHVQQVTFWILLGFLPTFITARLLVHFEPRLFLDVHGTHVHHFTYGVIILAIAGFISLVSPKRNQAWLAFLYGIGLALAFDEFGMWLRLTSNYNLDQSEDVMVAILAFLFVVVYFKDIIRKILAHYRNR
jgi:hypothetical protein